MVVLFYSFLTGLKTMTFVTYRGRSVFSQQSSPYERCQHQYAQAPGISYSLQQSLQQSGEKTPSSPVHTLEKGISSLHMTFKH